MFQTATPIISHHWQGYSKWMRVEIQSKHRGRRLDRLHCVTELLDSVQPTYQDQNSFFGGALLLETLQYQADAEDKKSKPY